MHHLGEPRRYRQISNPCPNSWQLSSPHAYLGAVLCVLQHRLDELKQGSGQRYITCA